MAKSQNADAPITKFKTFKNFNPEPTRGVSLAGNYLPIQCLWYVGARISTGRYRRTLRLVAAIKEPYCRHGCRRRFPPNELLIVLSFSWWSGAFFIPTFNAALNVDPFPDV